MIFYIQLREIRAKILHRC